MSPDNIVVVGPEMVKQAFPDKFEGFAKPAGIAGALEVEGKVVEQQEKPAVAKKIRFELQEQWNPKKMAVEKMECLTS